MKNLNEYPTPETDEMWEGDGKDMSMIEFTYSLERRLAACRETLEECDFLAESMAFSAYGLMRTSIRKTLTATAKP